MTNGNGVDLSGPLAGMWRDVYRKAAGVAEARAQELLKYHVYTYPHGAGDGGGGGGGTGGLVLVETRTLADDTAATVTFDAIPAAGAGLVLVVAAQQVVPGGSATAGSLLLRVNDDAGTNYATKWHEVHGTASPVTHATAGDLAAYLPLGRLPILGGSAPADAGTGIVAFLPGHGQDGRRKQVVTLGSAYTFNTHWLGQYGGEWRGTAPVSKLTLVPSGLSATFATGSVFTLYQLSLAGGGGGDGGGGTTEVTITTDASLTATEAPANTFALAARLSPDAGNALSLHANGLYATDTGTGGGGTGNTTMFTQTGTPTGAENSLWFNPSETA